MRYWLRMKLFGVPCDWCGRPYHRMLAWLANGGYDVDGRPVHFKCRLEMDDSDERHA